MIESADALDQVEAIAAVPGSAVCSSAYDLSLYARTTSRSRSARPSRPCWTTTRLVRRWPGSPPRRPTRASSSAPSPASRRTPPGSPPTASAVWPWPPTSGCSRPAPPRPSLPRKLPTDARFSPSILQFVGSFARGGPRPSGVASAGRGPGCRRARCARRSAGPSSARAGRRRCRSAAGRPAGRG